MKKSDAKKKQGKIIKIFFWGMVAPVMFAVFMRLFFVLFHFVYTPVLEMAFGSGAGGYLFLLSIVTSIALTVGVVAWTYKQLKTHIIDN